MTPDLATRQEQSVDNDLALANLLLDRIHEILVLPAAKEEEVSPELLSLDKMREVESMLWGIRKLSTSLSRGELDYMCRERGYVVGALKAFQSNLRHLTWQVQRIAGGELNHRVNFLGDFSVAFNQMAEQLDQKINNLTNISEEYKNQSYHDPLTGLYNRAAFFSYVEKSFFSQTRPGGVSTLIMADIDKFKHVNDTYGHLAGDEVLKAFADKLISVLRPDDLCCRYGGEEFLLFLPNTSVKIGANIAERLRQSVEEMLISIDDGVELKITSSFGLSDISPVEPGWDFEEHLKSRIKIADDNLYKAKTSGRNRVIY